MTPEERTLITDLFDRMRRQRLSEVDGDAAALIAREVRDNPDAAYQLVQSVIVQNMALERAEGRIRDLEDDLREIEGDRDRDRTSGRGSFLGGLFGGGRRDRYDDDDRDDDDDRWRRRERSRDEGDYRRDDDRRDDDERNARQGRPRTSVPSAGFDPRDSSRANPWSGGAAGQPVQQPARSGGGSFLGTALTTATGVAGGMLLAEGIRGLFNDGSGVASAAEAAKSAGGSLLGEQKAATETSGQDHAGVTDASHAGNDVSGGEGGGFFDSLFGGGGDDAGDDDLMDI